MPDRAEQYYIYQLLEPTDVLRVGNHKRYLEVKRRLVDVVKDTRLVKREDDSVEQDEFLKRHNIL